MLGLKPDARAKWLTKAVLHTQDLPLWCGRTIDVTTIGAATPELSAQHPQDGRLEAKVLYDIISHQKFGNELTEKFGKRMSGGLVE